MDIQILSVNLEDKGKYQMLDVAFKSEGQTKGKKLMSFGAGAEVFKVLKSAPSGSSWSVSSQKNDKGFWDWVSITQGGSSSASSTPSYSGGSTVASPAPKSNYETAEERANRQVLIVRQSSVSNAVEFFKLNTKKVPSIEEVIQVARQIEDYVFGKKSVAAGEIPELTDDLPY